MLELPVPGMLELPVPMIVELVPVGKKEVEFALVGYGTEELEGMLELPVPTMLELVPVGNGNEVELALVG